MYIFVWCIIHAAYTVHYKHPLQQQYVFVYKALLEAIQTVDTVVPSSEIEARYPELKKRNGKTGKNAIQEQFAVRTPRSVAKQKLMLTSMNGNNFCGQFGSHDILCSY